MSPLALVLTENLPETQKLGPSSSIIYPRLGAPRCSLTVQM